MGDNICVWLKKNGGREGRERKKVIGKSRGMMSGMDVRYTDIFFLPALFQPDSRGLFGMEGK